MKKIIQQGNDIHQTNESGSGYASAATNPQDFVSNLGMDGPNRTRFTPFNIIANTKSKGVLPDNRWRNYLMFQNNSGADIFVGFGTNVGSLGENGFKISTGGFYELNWRVPFNAVFIIGTSTSQQVLIIEGTIDRAQGKYRG